MASIIELLGVFLSSFGLGLIPFAGPSNLFIASNSALIIGENDPATLVMIGFLVALGAALAKSVHYLVTFFVSKHLSKKRQQRLDEDAQRVKRWAFLLLFAAAATPIPDEPVVIPLGLMKYNPAKFFTAFFFGKLSITIVGAFFGSWIESSQILDQNLLIVLSIVLTAVITVILLKVDAGKLIEKITAKFTKKKKKQIKQPQNTQTQPSDQAG
ncbi:MAG: VTT domain-containing protein [Candidatus Bathyarchaeota archaeon]|nr:VTT domain-containing protein [Candidatus Bathyarchaeota archaeon]